MVIFQFWYSLKGKSGIHHFETSKKIAFWWVWHLTLRVTKKFSVGIQYPTCVLASFLRIISICWNKREHHTTSQSDFTIQNVSWWWFFSFDTPSKVKVVYTISKPPKKLLFDGCDTWLWGSPKNVLLVSSTQHVYLQASLGSYLSAKTNGSITRHSNRILQSKTWADGDFLVLILPEERIPLCVIFENMSKCVILMKCFHFKVL